MTKALIIFPVVFFSLVCCAAATVVYVDASSEAISPDGTAWSRAFAHLQDALAAAAKGDEIRVAAGVYYPDLMSSDPNARGDRTAAFELSSGVAIRGGYAGLGAGDPNARDWRVFESILSGDLGGNDAPIASIAALTTDHTHDENSHNVVRGTGVDATAVLDGFTIRGSGASATENVSAAGLLLDGAWATISHCLFIDNLGEHGGGLAIYGGGPSVVNCMFMGNWARIHGGAIYAAQSQASLVNCLFSGNRAAEGGGGLFHHDGRTVLLNCTFSGNWAGAGGDGLYVSAGSVAGANSILYEEITLLGGTADFRYSAVAKGLSGEGNVHVDPQFVAPFGADSVPGTVDDDLRLSPGSPCIDAGDPLRMVDPNELDLSGRERINNGIVDMGAYEFKATPTLVGHWKLDEAGGAIAADSAGISHGTLAGDPVWAPLDGRIDGTLQFDGQGDYVNCGNNAVFNIRNAITVSAWVKVDAFTTSWQGIVTKGDSAWRLQGVGTDDVLGTLEFACTGVMVPYTEWGNILGNIRVDDGQWHHAAGVYDGLTMSLYVDGVLDVTSVASGQIAVNNYDVCIGENAQQRGRFWRGQIDEVRVYNYALSPYEIAELANPSTIYHVNIAGNNLNDGLSRSTAFRDIQRGIFAARDGDTVLVWPGVYNEQVNFLRKAITVRSAAEAAVVQTPVGYAFSFYTAEGPQSVLSHFIIRDSYRAVYCLATSPTLKNLTIINNDFGIESYQGAQPDIRNCIFWNNRYGNTAGCSSRYSWDWQPPPAVARWKFDETGGKTVYDSVNGNHGTMYDGVRGQGQVGGGIELDGDRDYVLIPNSASISVGRGNYTLSAWVRPRTVDGVQVILGKAGSYTNREYVLALDGGRIRHEVERDGNNGQVCSEAVVTANIWQHVAVTFNSATLTSKFYYNGLPVGQDTTESPITALPYALNAPLSIGVRGTLFDDEFAGGIDEVMIFDRALSAEDIRTVHGNALNPMFADPANNDYHLRSERGRYVPLNPLLTGGLEGLWAFDHMTSPCIDGGDPDERPSREPMPNGGRVNMGAYGNTPYASRSEWLLEGDMNQDGCVDLADFAIMASGWLERLPWAVER
ncbi:MAG: hypothetical protein IH624_12945 [Phycisphaerae bacterium]|nr:hypothetical protein [Phycisphaerae bacterium]